MCADVACASACASVFVRVCMCECACAFVCSDKDAQREELSTDRFIDEGTKAVSVSALATHASWKRAYVS